MHASEAPAVVSADIFADFSSAAASVCAQVVRTEVGRLPDLIASYHISLPDGSVGYSLDVRRVWQRDATMSRPSQPEIWISRARLGIASTGTVLVAEPGSDDRRQALLSAKHVLLLPAHSLVATYTDAVPYLEACIDRGLRYITLITGPSRTSDIEKVLTLGAHGPVALDIVLVEGWYPADD